MAGANSANRIEPLSKGELMPSRIPISPVAVPIGAERSFYYTPEYYNWTHVKVIIRRIGYIADLANRFACICEYILRF